MLKDELLLEIDKFRAEIYPDRCCFCFTPIDYKTEICPSCRKTVKIISGIRCMSCGMSKNDCDCKGKSNFYSGITAPYIYDGVVRDGIIRWKYRENIHALPFFAKETAKCIHESFSSVKFDAVTFIPQTAAEEKEKGINQSEILAQEVGKYLKIPTVKLIEKIFETSRQHNLPMHMRSGNVFGAFGCPAYESVKGKTILLIDDIKTSGNTLNECAKVLQLNDASEVYCAVIAIARSNKRKKK
ncbi:MAG: ComF family protein [Clostridia bacterium]|nr:ComF family protein [Clostridia bacterium]